MLHRSMVVLCLASLTAVAHAKPTMDPAGAPVPTADPSPTTVPAVVAPAPAPSPKRGGGFRNGFSLSVGQEWGSGPSSGLSGQLYGLDWRIGTGVTDAIAIYVHTHLSLGTAEIGAVSGMTGNFAGALVAEYTLPQRIFFAGGGGYGVLNNPSGPLAEARVGYYPFAHPTGTGRRMNIAVDARWYFAGAGVGTVTHVALSLGYDRF